MPATSSHAGSGGFTTAERAAMKQRAAELRAEGKKGTKKADDLQAVLDSIAKMAAEDRAFKNSGKFNTRYSTLEFQDAANLDDGDLWPVSFALRKWSPAVEQRVVLLVQAAVS